MMGHLWIHDRSNQFDLHLISGYTASSCLSTVSAQDAKVLDFFTILHNVKMFRKLLRLKSEVIGNIHPSMSHTCLKFHTYMT